MLSIVTCEPIRSAAATHTDPTLRAFLALRMGQLTPIDDGPSIRFIVFEAGDTLDALEAELGFTPMESVPSWEWIEAHPGWFELAYVFTDDGDGIILFVSRAKGVDPDLLALCNRWSVT